MSNHENAGGDFEFPIPPPSPSRVIALGYATLILLIVFFATLHAGGSFDNPIFWLILLGVSPVIFFFVLMAFPPLRWRARVEVQRDAIRYVPVPPLRWIGETATALAITKETQEILICRGSRDTYGGFFVSDSRPFPYGMRVILRDADGSEKQLRVKTGNRLSPHQAKLLVEGITSATGLPVRTIKREIRDGGALQENPWSPDNSFASSAGLAKFVFAAAPLLGGVVVGLLRASGVTAALVGISLWLAQTVGMLIAGSLAHQRSKLTWVFWLTTVFTFAASYTVVFLITENILRSR